MAREQPVPQSGLLVGAGTVLEVAQVEAVAAAGASFVVSPVVDETVIGRARDLGLLTIPGCYSPTEMMRAHKAGADLVKLFPGPADGPGFVRACLGPMPFLKIFPTGGVTLENARAGLDALQLLNGIRELGPAVETDGRAEQGGEVIATHINILLQNRCVIYAL